MNGSPVKPFSHEQIGLWLLTWHLAFMPQVPGQGSVHFWLIQALSSGHSELTTHSGLQLGGLPTYVGKHEHTAWPFTSRHWLFEPHGDGWQGLTYSFSITDKKYLGFSNKVMKNRNR